MLIEEMMTKNVYTLQLEHSIDEAFMLMNEKKIRHLPITTIDGTLVGIVSDRDIKDALPSTLSSLTTNGSEVRLKEIMTKNPITGHPLDFVEEAAVLFYEHKIGCLPIISKNKLVGIVTETDLLYKYIELTGAHQPGSQIEIRVPNVPGSLFEVTNFFYEHNANILSVLIYSDKESPSDKILVIRVNTMNPLPIIENIRNHGYDVLLPSFSGLEEK